MNNGTVKLGDRAILMQLSATSIGKTRGDGALTQDVKVEHSLGSESGRWVMQRYPRWLLKPIEQLVTAARAYHDAVTFPYIKGVGILPGPLVMEYGDRMRDFRRQLDALLEVFKAKYGAAVEWAKNQQNGQFVASDYALDDQGNVDPAQLDELCKEFTLQCEPMPVPDSDHFSNVMRELLGVDAESVDARVVNAMHDSQVELMRRMIAPVKAMAVKLAEPVQIKTNKKGEQYEKGPTFRDTLVENIVAIADLVPKMNLAGDPQLDEFAREMKGLTNYSPTVLRDDKATREEGAKAAKAMLERLEGYKL